VDHIDERMIAFAVERLQTGIRDRADRLRKLADEIDQAVQKIGTVGPEYPGAEIANNYGYQASQVVHVVIGVLPNLSLDQLGADAADLDRTVAAAELRETRGELEVATEEIGKLMGGKS
jgi:hypothetical protein